MQMKPTSSLSVRYARVMKRVADGSMVCPSLILGRRTKRDRTANVQVYNDVMLAN
ncbi:hypothetical protein BDS110ZK25_80680 [Bradyrhizobium diazoefficiens]